MAVNLTNRLDRNSFCATVVSLSNDNPLANQLEPGAGEFITLPRRSRFDLRPALQIREIIHQGQIDSILAFDIFSFFYIWYALRKIPSKPKVFISIHNAKFNNYKDLVKNFIIARLLSGKELFISVSEKQADYWAKTYLIPRKRFITIPNGVDTDSFYPENNQIQKATVRSTLEIPDKAFVILQVASLTEEKRHQDALIAFQLIVDFAASNNPYLVLVGDGPEKYRKHLQQIADELGISERVLFCGAQNDVKPFYTASDLFTLTSRTEAFSVAALEAMSMGLPCVLTDVGGCADMVVEGMNGYLVEPLNPQSIAQGWLAAFENIATFEDEKIRNWVIEHYSLSKYVQQYENLLQQK